MERFIALWAGGDWLLSPEVTFIVIMNFFLMGMRQPDIIVIEAADYMTLPPKEEQSGHDLTMGEIIRDCDNSYLNYLE